MKMSFSCVLLLSLCLAGAVLAAEVKSDYDRAFDLSKLQSFRFVEQSRRNPKDALAADEIADKRIRAALKKNLIALGMRHEQAAADFEIAYFASLRNQTQVTTSGRPRWGMGAVWVDQYVQGTAVVEFRDAKSGELIWRGFTTATVDPDKSEAKINKGVKNLVERFAKDREKQRKAGNKS